MCYSDETCTVTCPGARKRRSAGGARMFSNDVSEIDGVALQENGLPGKKT